MVTDLGNLSLSITANTAALDQLESRLNNLNRMFGAPLKITVDTGPAVTQINTLTQSAQRPRRA